MASPSDTSKTKAQLCEELLALRKQVGDRPQAGDMNKTKAQLIEELHRLRKRANAAAPKSEDRRRSDGMPGSLDLTRTLMENVPGYVSLVDQQLRIVKINQAYADFLGLDSPEEAVAKTCFDFFTPEDAQILCDEDRSVLESGKAIIDKERKLRSRGGATIWLSENKLPVTDETGQAIGLLNLSTDISERKQTRERLEGIVASLEDIVYSVDAETREFTYISPALEKILGYTMEDIKQMGGRQAFMSQVIDRATVVDKKGTFDEQEDTFDQIAALRTDQVPVWRSWWRSKDGTLKCLEDRSIAIYEGDRLVSTQGVLRDVTERLQAEEALQQAKEALEQHTADLERRSLQLQSASEVAREATTILDTERLINETVRMISDRFGFYHTALFLVDEQGKYAMLRAASSEGGLRMLERSHKLEIGAAGIVGHVASTAEARIALDVGADATYFRNPDLPETRSEMALPLRVRDRVIGVLDVQSTEPEAFTEEDATALQTMADQLAIAIENARLLARTEDQLRELNRFYGEQLATAWAEAAAGGRPTGYIYDRIDVMPIGKSPSPALDVALEQNRTISLVNPQANEAVLATPIRVRGQLIGTLGVQKTGGSREWLPEEIALVEIVGDQIGLALDSARLFSEARIRAEELVVLNELAQNLTSSLNSDEVIQRAYEGVTRLLHTPNFYLGLYDPRREVIDFVFDVSESEIDRSITTVPARRGIAGYIVQNRKSVLIKQDLDGWLRETGIESIGANAASWLGVPLLIGDRVLGVMAVQDYAESNAYDEHDQDLLMSVASQTAIAIQNVRLLEQTQRRAEQERQTYEITSKLRRSPDIQTILQTAVEELGRVMRTDRAVVRLMTKAPTEEKL